MVKWFTEQGEQHVRVAFMLPLYYLQRGRLAEALHAYSRLKEAFRDVAGSLLPTVCWLHRMPVALIHEAAVVTENCLDYSCGVGLL